MSEVALTDIPDDFEDSGLDSGSAVKYWDQAREPLACLVFLVPLLAIYELGVLWHGSVERSIRNGADYWMRSWLQQAGIDAWVLPGLVVGLLLMWHRWGRYPWRLSRETLVGMFAESLLFAFALTAVRSHQNRYLLSYPSRVL